MHPIQILKFSISIVKYHLVFIKELNLKSPYEYPNFVEYIIKDNRIKDEAMEESRTYLYRPNFKKYIKDRNITL